MYHLSHFHKQVAHMLMVTGLFMLVSLQLFGVFQFMSTGQPQSGSLTCTMSFHNEEIVCPFKWIDSAWEWFSDLTVVPLILLSYLILLMSVARFTVLRLFRIPWKWHAMPRVVLQCLHRMHIVPNSPLHDAFSNGIIHPKVYCLYR